MLYNERNFTDDFREQTCEEELWGELHDWARPWDTGRPHESWLSELDKLIELGDLPITSLPLRDRGDLTEFLLCLSIVWG